jgi:hypothetical protein
MKFNSSQKFSINPFHEVIRARFVFDQLPPTITLEEATGFGISRARSTRRVCSGTTGPGEDGHLVALRKINFVPSLIKSERE